MLGNGLSIKSRKTQFKANDKSKTNLEGLIGNFWRGTFIINGVFFRRESSNYLFDICLEILQKFLRSLFIRVSCDERVSHLFYVRRAPSDIGFDAYFAFSFILEMAKHSLVRLSFFHEY